MKLLLYFGLLLLGNSGVLYLLDAWGIISITADPFVYFLVTVILSLLHTILKPLLKIVTFPFYILTFGLFAIVINALLLWLTDYIMKDLLIEGFMQLLYATVLLSLVHSFLHAVFRGK